MEKKEILMYEEIRQHGSNPSSYRIKEKTKFSSFVYLCNEKYVQWKVSKKVED